MDCDRFVINLSAYLDGELGEEERAELEAHLRGCPTCVEELALLKESAEMLSMLAPQGPLRDLWSAISREFGLTRRERRAEVASLMRLVFKRPLPAAAALLACLITALLGYWKTASQPMIWKPPQAEISTLDADKVLESSHIMAGSWGGFILPAKKEPGQSKEKVRGKDTSQGLGSPPTLLT